ncbi:sigma-70 family RNA polymerase sigma factor [Akkermansiaceae bacterium]|nr:sigma-70 family RNA polymerase sigma factor [Akkermansiaceae bacterium]MDB4669694.1 sigma-70 family RNA polymerase sigma factor [bacterium]MDB2430514.1 sigma-70 family RNA polymerase sigma factor [Akkermansiaceae bacterium]MDB4754200.1 sigma-70 family RNA polymerase sigma factor [Akkermansiaceae bacterium]MDB4759070.1 sigma-70 family RNA polymerase sigma factor [Akkermansiaceae bacterium]
MIDLSDSDLVLAARGGDFSASDEIVHRHHEKIYAFLHKLTGRREDAEDLTQETFLLALRKLHTFKEGCRLPPWLFTIARRQAIAQWRKVKPTCELFDADHPTESGRQPHDAVALWKIAKEKLKRDEFIALWLFYQEGFSIKELAKTLRKTTPHIKVILHRARKRLGEHLNNTPDLWLPGQTLYPSTTL